MKIIAVAAGMLKPKKNEQEYSSLYLNYGLLGLATNLNSKGYEVEMFQGDYKTIPSIIQEITEKKLTRAIVLLSVPSFLSVDWAIAFAKEIRKYAVKILVGGRWVFDTNFEWAKKKFGDLADGFSLGCPDDCVELLADPKKWKLLEEPKKYSTVFSKLNYSLLNNFKTYQPSIEVSRGCGMGCSFCLERAYKNCGLKSPQSIFEEIEHTAEIYGDSNLNYYFESSIFLPSKKWANEFAKIYKKTGSTFHWRCTTRVDTVNSEALSVLAEAGLKVVDFGLESASPSQLISMQKTKKPDEYLKKAESVIFECAAKNVWCKLNILLYAGETLSTFNETKRWLLDRKAYIKGISTNTLTIYLNGDMGKYLESIENITKRKINRKELYQRGFTYPDLSTEIDKDKSLELCNELNSLLMTAKDYNDLKEICYSAINVENKNA
ncbi:MAG: radical SAM protein [Clostridia bacterium]|nr:radical SAM protein [Clostridia bacterium]